MTEFETKLLKQQIKILIMCLQDAVKMNKEMKKDIDNRLTKLEQNPIFKVFV